MDIGAPEDENLIHRKAAWAAIPCDHLVPFDVHKAAADTGEEGMHIVALAVAVGMERKRPCVEEV